MSDVLFIAGVGRSGSTVLDLLLGGHSKLVGLGEVDALVSASARWVDQADEILCSCGQSANGCEFWGPVFKTLAQNGDAPEQVRQTVHQAFEERFDAGTLLVDSSKHSDALERLVKFHDQAGDAGSGRVRVLHLVRDVRANYISRLNRSPGAMWKRWPRFYYWYKKNRELETAIDRCGFESMVVSYEQLCFEPERILTQICEFAGLEFETAMLGLETSGSHNILGNRMRHDPAKRRAISYDARWMADRRWLLPYLLMPRVARYNEEVLRGGGSAE